MKKKLKTNEKNDKPNSAAIHAACFLTGSRQA
jgi:hypothetical protein